MKKLLTIIFAVISLQAMATPEDSNDLLNDNNTTPSTPTSTGKSSQPKLIIVKSSANPQAENRAAAKPKHVAKPQQHKEVHKKHKHNKKKVESTKKVKQDKANKKQTKKKKSTHKPKSNTNS